MTTRYLKIWIPLITAAFLLTACDGIPANLNINNNSTQNSLMQTESNTPFPISPTISSVLSAESSSESLLGLLQELTTDTATIDGQVYNLSSNVELKGILDSGTFVEYKLVQLDDGTWVISEIEYKNAEQSQSGESDDHNKGIFNSLDGSSVVIDGMTYPLSPNAKIEGSLIAGALVEFEWNTQSDGSKVIVKIEVKSSEDQYEDDDDNKGLLESIDDNSVAIDGVRYPLSPTVKIEGVLVPGTLVEFEWMTLSDGSVVIVKIESKSLSDSSSMYNDDDQDDDSSSSDSNDDNSDDDDYDDYDDYDDDDDDDDD